MKDGQAERAVRLYEIFLSGALEHFLKVQKLYEKSGRNQLWMDLVESVRWDHSRKYSFSPDFEKIVAGRGLKKPETFKTRAMKRWKKQIS